MFNLEIKEMLIMKYKKIMLIALLLLAVLTISAVSASDDAALDNVTASDDVDVIVSDPDDSGDSGDDSGDDTEGGDTGEEEYGAWFNESKINLVHDYDENVVVATMTVPNTITNGTFVISNDYVNLFNASIGSGAWKTDEKTKGLVCEVLLGNLSTQFGNIHDGDVIYFDFLDEYDDPIEDYCAQALLKLDRTSYTIQLVDIEVYVYADEVNVFNLSDDDDLNEPFAFILAPSQIKGNFTIYVEDEENYYYFNKNLTEMVGSPDAETGLMRYSVSLNDLNNLSDFVEEEYFTIALLSLDEYNEWECADYEITYNDEKNTVSFTEIVEPEGEELDAYIVEEVNALTDDVIIAISKDEIPEDVVDGFDVYIYGDEYDHLKLKLSDFLDNASGQYLISVGDLFYPSLLDRETEVGILLQFYDEDGDGIAYVEAEDVLVYVNPYISDDENMYEDGDVIQFSEIEGADDEFTVTISQQGHEDIVKKFKISELENVAEDDEDPFYVLKLSDLNLTEAGDYGITVNFTQGGEPLISNVAFVSISGDLEIWTPDIEEGTHFENIQDALFVIRVTEEFEGYVKLFVNETQIPGNISLSELGWSIGPPGREVILNDFNITESGNYTFKVEVYDAEGKFINEATFDAEVVVGTNTVDFNDVFYTQDGFIEFNLNAPVANGTVFIISLNGKPAGIYNPRAHDIVWTDDQFVDTWYDGHVKFLKAGSYVANLTSFNWVTETVTPFASGSFSILSMNSTKDKEFYLEGDKIIITFDGVYYADKSSELSVRLIKGWDEMGPYYKEIANFNTTELKDLYSNGTFSFTIDSLPVGDNMIMIHYMVAEDEFDLEDENYIYFASDAINVDVFKPIDPNLTISVGNIFVGESAVVKITTNETFSGNVTVTIANKNYTVSVVNGKGAINVANLAEGPYTATAIFAAQGIFLGSAKNTTFTVTKKPVPPAKKADKIKLTLKKVKVKKSAKKLVLRATLKINGKAVKGKKITFKFKGKKYKAKTNKKGVAKVTIKKKVLKKLKVGKKVKYQATYGKVTKKYTVKVKK